MIKKRKKLIGNLIAFIKTVEVIPVDSNFDLPNDSTKDLWFTSPFIDKKRLVRLRFSREKLIVVLKKIKNLYSDKMHENEVSEELNNFAINCYKKNLIPTSRDEISTLINVIDGFIEDLNQTIFQWEFILPIQGIISEKSFQIGNCKLIPYKIDPIATDSNLMNEITKSFSIHEEISEFFTNSHINENRFESFEDEVTAFLKFSIQEKLHETIAKQQALNEAELSLHILRLFLSSNKEIYTSRLSQKLGVLGSFRETNKGSMLIVRKSDSNSTYSSHAFAEVFEPYTINSSLIAKLKTHWLDNLNQMIATRHRLNNRLLRGISWFGKATITNKSAEAFMMYAIAIECLFSEGNTSENKYSEYVATLLIQNSSGIGPIGGSLTNHFYLQLEQTRSVDEKRNLVKRRFNQLFLERNKIAHGAVYDYEISNQDLGDMETLVRNTIISMIGGQWDNFKEFKNWIMDQQIE